MTISVESKCERADKRKIGIQYDTNLLYSVQDVRYCGIGNIMVQPVQKMFHNLECVVAEQIAAVCMIYKILWTRL